MIRELLYSVGGMAVQPRVAIALGIAITDRCLPSKDAKPPKTMALEIPVGE